MTGTIQVHGWAQLERASSTNLLTNIDHFQIANVRWGEQSVSQLQNAFC